MSTIEQIGILIRSLTCPLDIFIEKITREKRDQSYEAHMFHLFEILHVL